MQYVSAVGSGDHTADTATTAFTGTGVQLSEFTDILTGIDVTTSAIQGALCVLAEFDVSAGTASRRPR
ncbi:hypothetical protein ABB07_25940 [Streptomyces incarnatus]|uniref:Uncharacterized protein n=1 Tax=Streptomyces incarnatus TaxID=665007 RepID=A0ABM5TQR3_9ACTN|nr:hypothetical protein [Streptomyces incarnatus]AKJ13348.1 hypothetical protein ABB07_25940 [Streptomyces incarnatus]